MALHSKNIPSKSTTSHLISSESKSSTRERIDSLNMQIASSDSAYLKHKRKGVNQCSICLKNFPYPSKLSRHLLSHTNFKPFQCNVCSKSFRYLCHLRSHQMIHKKSAKERSHPLSKTSDVICTHQPKNKYQCEICLKIFSFPSKLTRHLIVHLDAKPHTCTICQKSFSQTSYLNKHLKLHSRKRKKPSRLPGVQQNHRTKSPTLGALGGTNNCRPGVSNVSLPQKLDSVDTQTYEVLDCNGKLHQNLPLTDSKSNTVETEMTECLKDTEVQTAAYSPETLEHRSKGVNQCSICLKNFPYPSKLSSHLLSHKDFIQFQCNLCSKSFRNLCHWRSHQMIHKKSAKKSIDSVSKTSEHIGSCQLKTKSGHQCEICLKIFRFPSKLTQHRFIHEDVKLHTCTICQKSFRLASYLNKHLKLHTRKRNNPFGIPGVPQNHRTKSLAPLALGGTNNCRPGVSNVSLDSADTQTYKVLQSNGKLNQNIPLTESKSSTIKIEVTDCLKDAEVHTASYSLVDCRGVNQCSICLKNFPYPSKLSRHLLSHTDFKPFQCNVCSKSFRYLCHLRSHQMIHKKSAKERSHPLSKTSDVICTHQPKKKYQCDICLKIFSFPSKLTRHLIVHLDAKPHTCTICQKSFSQTSYLNKHLKLHSRKRKKPSRLPGVPQNHRTKSPILGALGGTNNCRPGVSNVSLTLKLDSLDTQTYEVLDCNGKLNQNLPLTESKSSTIETEMTECLKDTEVQTAAYSPETLEHRSKGVNQCSICLKNFPYPSKLSRHLLSHKDFIQFQCNLCSKSFRNLCHWRSHQMIHKKTAKKRIHPVAKISEHIGSCQLKTKSGHQCEICLKIFSFPSKLTQHRFIHEEVKLHTCTICQKSFRLASYLNKHLKLHTRKRNNPFGMPGVPQKHRTKSPTPGALGGTNNCRPGVSNVSLPQKLDSADSQTYKVLQSNGKLNQNIPLTESKSSTIKIEVTDCLKDAEVHTASYSLVDCRGVNQCSICLKNFPYPSKLSRHLLSHTDFKPFKCNVCSKLFRHLYHLQSHQKIHKKKGEDIIAGDLEQVNANSFDNTVKFEDKDVHISSQDGAEDFETAHQDQNMVTDMLSQKRNDDCSDSGVFFSSSTGLLENVEIKSEFVFQSSNKSVWGLTNNTDTVLVEEKASDIMPFGRMSDWPPKTDSSLQHCISESRIGEYWTCHMGDIDEDCSLVDPDPFKPDDPNVRETVVVVELQDSRERLTKPPCDFPTCPDCSQCFTTISQLYAHKCANRYPEERIKKSHQCDICFKVFNAPSKLKRHGVTHTGQRPFQCSQCQRTFTQSHHLKTHMLSHR